MQGRTVCFLVALGAGLPAAAEVVSAADNGCVIRQSVHLAASPGEVYDAVIQPAKWWNSEHTFSGSAANLTLEARAGGCFCEKLPDGGSVQHLEVVAALPGKTLVLRGAMGPFQGQGVAGVLTWKMATAPGGGTDLTLTYALGGYLTLPGGFAEWSKRADGMFATQIASLQKFFQTSPH
jgi:uncharacterized protein YndB with AHSA1/START domain